MEAERGLHPLESQVVVSYPKWALEIEPMSSGGLASDPNHRGISPAPPRHPKLFCWSLSFPPQSAKTKDLKMILNHPTTLKLESVSPRL